MSNLEQMSNLKQMSDFDQMSNLEELSNLEQLSNLGLGPSLAWPVPGQAQPWPSPARPGGPGWADLRTRPRRAQLGLGQKERFL